MDLSVVIPVLNERENIEQLLPRAARVLQEIGCTYEVVVVDGGSTDGTAAAATAGGARVLRQKLPGYGGALREGLLAARGTFILTLDADLSHDPDFIVKLWRARLNGDVAIASRYVKGGVAYMPFHRLLLSRVLNGFFARGLGLPVRDLSSGFRLYRASAVQALALEGTNFEVLEEILVKAYAEGWRIVEVPFTYYPRERGSSHARIVAFGLDLLRAFFRLWRLRNSIESADYDERAFYSVIPLQRWWQRRRHQIICEWARGAGKTLDVGCGSSIILQSINHVVGIDILHNKLRYMRRYDVPVVRASTFALPIADEQFDCVISSQVIEHIPYDDVIFTELRRVLRPGGLLILGTPDYATIGWRTIEPLYGFFAPGGYKDEHITHYTRDGLIATCRRFGFELEDVAYVFRSELVLALRKRPLEAEAFLGAPAAGSPAELLTPIHPERVREGGEL
ncbi:MAG TPA: glycosyltransferase [Candidatus Binatia bacterium]|jgi:glycosyltransferase involved in cell wall biosynthesis